MHELSAMIRLVDIAVRCAGEQGAEKVSRIDVDVGAMTGIIPEWLEHYFPQASAGTCAEGAILEIHSIPVKAKCMSCGKVYIPDRGHDRACPSCGSKNASLISGRELAVRSVELSDFS